MKYLIIVVASLILIRFYLLPEQREQVQSGGGEVTASGKSVFYVPASWWETGVVRKNGDIVVRGQVIGNDKDLYRLMTEGDAR